MENYDQEDLTALNGCLQTLIYVFERTDDRMSEFVPEILPALFGAFTSSEANDKIREKVLMNVYLSLRTFAWADGVNDELVHKCLDDTFNTWMALFIQII